MADIVITFPGVTGSSQVAEHTGWIDIHSFVQGIHSPADATSSSGASAGQSSLYPFSFSAEEGVHCVPIILNGTAGKHFDTVQVDYLKQTGAGKPEVYKTCVMTEVYITDYSSQRAEGSVGSESWSMSAAKAKWEFFKQNADGGLESIGNVTVNARTGEVA